MISSKLVDKAMEKVVTDWDLVPVPYIVRESMEWLEQKVIEKVLDDIDKEFGENMLSPYEVMKKMRKQQVGE